MTISRHKIVLALVRVGGGDKIKINVNLNGDQKQSLLTKKNMTADSGWDYASLQIVIPVVQLIKNTPLEFELLS